MHARYNPDAQVELLHERMRILEFAVDPEETDSNLFVINLKIAIGGNTSDLDLDKTFFRYVDEADLADLNALEVSPTAPNAVIQRCQPAETFCAVINLKTRAFRKII